MATDAELLALRREHELAAEPEDASAAAARSERLEIHTALPGIVRAFDRVAMTVKVQPAVKRRWIDAGFLPLPELVNVPVQFPRFGNFIIIGPVRAGDEGLVHFAERAIDNWHNAGGVQEPSEYRLHDLSDGFFAPGYMSEPRAADVSGGAPDDAIEIRTLDGSTMFRVQNDAAIAGTPIGAEKAIKGETYRTAEQTENQTLAATFTAMAGLCTGPLGPLAAGFTALAAAVNAFEGGSLGFLASKAKVG